MNKYLVTLKRVYDYEEEIIAESEEEAINKVNEIMDDLSLSGQELYNEKEEVELLEEDVESEKETDE